MKKLNKVLYNKLLLQAEEAKERDMKKLASCILESIGSYPNEESFNYSFSELSEDVEKDMWKAAAKVMVYHDLNSVQVEKIEQILNKFAESLIDEVEKALKVNDNIGKLEAKLPGEKS